MNHVLRSLIGKCVIVYFDDILTYCTCLNDHLFHVRTVLEIFKKKNLFTNFEKCTFCTYEVVDEEKVKTIQEWPTPKTVGEVRTFHGLASFYRMFVKDFSTLVGPLNEIVKNSVRFKWKENQERALQVLKERLTQALI
ncbi:Retrovirus-related Pol polyprotein from transposon gypsy, partial [Mucuna pruriens]